MYSSFASGRTKSCSSGSSVRSREKAQHHADCLLSCSATLGLLRPGERYSFSSGERDSSVFKSTL